MKLTKEIERKLALLEALQAGGVDNWDGYDFATEEYRKTIGREETAEDIADEILHAICTEIEQPAGMGCGFDFSKNAMEYTVQIILKRAQELK